MKSHPEEQGILDVHLSGCHLILCWSGHQIWADAAVRGMTVWARTDMTQGTIDWGYNSAHTVDMIF